jgi:murein DD-endopeptidase MepM/ murein hydrolase activator NlpD
VTYVNGYETERSVTDTVTLVEATTTQVLKGTKEKPKTASTGTYKYPVSGYTISSLYGYRHGEFHTGLDMAVPYGTAVRAADGGTVTFAGRQSSGGYGNLVIITHDNGTQTYYAHNSSILVSVGDKVYQGQQIAKAGSTGRSTGNHCHFEIRINGETVNPLNYLK